MELTFEQICPAWNVLLEDGVRGRHYLDINDPQCCVVGESRGFDDRYYHRYGAWRHRDQCEPCAMYADLFAACIDTPGKINDHIGFETLRDNFVMHYNAHHKAEWLLRNLNRTEEKSAHPAEVLCTVP